jgi:hypothetical protein
LELSLRTQRSCHERDGTYVTPVRVQHLIARRRKYLDKFLTRTGPFTDPDMFEPGEAAIAGLERLKIL